MYPVGLFTLLQFLWEHGHSSFGLVALGLLLSAVFLWHCDWDQCDQNVPVSLPCFPLFSITSFFNQRHDFFAWGFRVTNQQLFQFRLIRNNVVVVSGERGRKDFLSAKGLDIQEGFRILSGAIPILHGVTTELHQQRVARIYKRLANVQRNERLTELIPEILDDGRRLLRPWEKAGTFDPFEKIYELMFQAMTRCLTCTEIADDPEIVARLRQLYHQVDRGTTLATVLFPWFPSPSMIKKARATKQIYDIVVKAIKVREQSGVPHNDTLQIFLDSGDEPSTIVGFMIGLVTAGARSSGTTASWLFTYLGCHPKWRNEARAEVKKLITSYSLEIISESNSPCDSPSTALFSVPLSAWERETPVLDMLLRETLRIAQPHVAMRRNVGPEMYIDGKVIPTGTLVVYPFANVHLNPALYPDPWKFDPARPLPKGDFSYLGWGGGASSLTARSFSETEVDDDVSLLTFFCLARWVGRVACLGSRLATLTIKLLAALVLSDFDFDTVDAGGRIADPAPEPNWNDELTCRPARGQFFLKYRRLDSSGPPPSCESSGTAGPL